MPAKIGVTINEKSCIPRESNISPICRDVPIGAIGLNFGMRGLVADIITRAKFCGNWFRSFRVLISQAIICANFGDDRLRSLGVTGVKSCHFLWICIVVFTKLLHHLASVWTWKYL